MALEQGALVRIELDRLSQSRGRTGEFAVSTMAILYVADGTGRPCDTAFAKFGNRKSVPSSVFDSPFKASILHRLE